MLLPKEPEFYGASTRAPMLNRSKTQTACLNVCGV
jgi:hypothetical protein